MRLPLAVFVLIAVFPLAEMVLLVVAASRIGIVPTIGLVIFTAALGSALVSRQGRGQLASVQRSLATGGFPTAELAHGAMILVAGVLLITPGFLTDTAGFLLLVPRVREGIRRFGARRLQRRVQVL